MAGGILISYGKAGALLREGRRSTTGGLHFYYGKVGYPPNNHKKNTAKLLGLRCSFLYINKVYLFHAFCKVGQVHVTLATDIK